MSDLERYLQLAGEARQTAGRANGAREREGWLAIARAWKQLADEVETRAIRSGLGRPASQSRAGGGPSPGSPPAVEPTQGPSA